MADDTQALHRLARMLDDEGRAIGAGDLRALARLAEGKAALVDEVEARAESAAATPAEAAALDGLRRQAMANQRRLGAALKGMRAALRRIDGLRRAGRSLQSYDASGRPQTIGLTPSSLERRA
ncbi:MAG: flagellar export chaperone FlgN [Defluviimonas sp.]|nr:flagellar export chaperone FlgN [Defluviimonas sp.]